MSACLRGGLVPRIVLESPTETALLNLVAERILIGFANSSLRQSQPTPGVEFLNIADLDIEMRLATMWRRDRETPAITLFMDRVIQHIGASQKIKRHQTAG
jgi:DNA-binding transcriptional LysR family regulator